MYVNIYKDDYVLYSGRCAAGAFSEKAILCQSFPSKAEAKVC